MTDKATYIPQKRSLFQKLKIKIFQLFRLRNAPTLRLYRGFSNGNKCFIYGHALSLSPLPRKKYRKFFIINSIALLRLFMVRTKHGARIKLLWNDREYETFTEKDGFFRFEWECEPGLQPGTYTVKAIWMKKRSQQKILSAAESEIVVPASTSYAFISDIDDTFLISHSSNLRKRLFVLLTENAKSRRPFDGAVKHYRLLHGIDDETKEDNAFFYVSSSEWNLYNYIREFVLQHELPDGVFLLNKIKTFSKLFSTGQSNHNGKFTRIVRIIESFPQQKFVLLGDDSQMDPDIYSSIVQHFPDSIYCVYIRRVGKPEKPAVRERQKEIEKAGVHFFYFAHSEEAILHSRSIGLVQGQASIS